MRNESMKKFGTPTGVGNGREKEKVGFTGVGTPPAPTEDGGVTLGLTVVPGVVPPEVVPVLGVDGLPPEPPPPGLLLLLPPPPPPPLLPPPP